MFGRLCWDQERRRGTDRSKFDLREIASLASYRGFVFGSLSADVPSIEDGWRGGDVDRPDGGATPDGEVGPETRPTRPTNRNCRPKTVSMDITSPPFTASSHTRLRRGKQGRIHRYSKNGIRAHRGRCADGVLRSGQWPHGICSAHDTGSAPIWEAKEWLEKELTPKQVEWILTKGRNLYLFPNVMLMDNPSTQIRVMKPVSADRVDITVYCIAPRGESDKARAGRLRKFEDFYLTAGMATSDDIAALEDTHEGSIARDAKWSEFNRGLAHITYGADKEAKELGFEPQACTDNWDHEVLYHGFYRHWLKMMKGNFGDERSATRGHEPDLS